MTASAALAAPTAPLLAASLLLGWPLIALAAIDIRIYRLPDALTLPLLATGLASTALLAPERLTDHLIGAAAGYAALAGVAWVYRRARGREGLGLGDAKLLAAGGAWLGWQALPSALLIASVAGLALLGLQAWRSGRVSLSSRLAFGGPLALAIWVRWLTAFPSPAPT